MQAAVYATYHMTNPSVFYNKEDLWEVPAIDGEARPQLMQPYYTVMRLPGERQAEFIQMLPFTPARKDNLASWMVARSDGEHYGRMLVFQFPKQKVVFGPRQVVARINQDQVISPQITLWNQQGSEVLQGTLLVIPIEESLIYIRPLYLRCRRRPHPRAEARHRRVPESHRDGRDARRRAQPAVPEGRRAFYPGADTSLPAHRPRRRPRLRRRAATNCPPARWITTAARSRRSERVTGRSTARRSSGSARCSRPCAPEDNGDFGDHGQCNTEDGDTEKRTEAATLRRDRPAKRGAGDERARENTESHGCILSALSSSACGRLRRPRSRAVFSVSCSVCFASSDRVLRPLWPVRVHPMSFTSLPIQRGRMSKAAISRRLRTSSRPFATTG